MNIDLVTLIVADYDPAIRFFVEVLGFDLVEDAPSTTNDGRAKRWVVVRPPGAATGILLAQADGERQVGAVGEQMAGRVGFFLRVADFDATYRRMTAAGVEIVTPPRDEAYGRVAVFRDIAGNRWDLLGPRPARWLFHVLVRDTFRFDAADRYSPESLAREGFIHCSYRDMITESARLYFPEGADLLILAIDPRRLDVPVDVAATPRGPMPHVHGSVPRAAIRIVDDVGAHADLI